MMKIVLIHYHLKTGGVTTVIRHQAAALQAAGWDVMILTGEAPPDDFPFSASVIPGLGYEHLRKGDFSAKSLFRSILNTIHHRWPAGPDLVHIHNPTLAKNKILQALLKKLQSAGLTLLCQIHDFAEDGRPDAFFDESYVEDCHYAVVNQRDFQLLLDAGLDENGCHLLPNPVSTPDIQSPANHDEQGPILYPIRAIRRKNIGEAILLSLYLKPPGQIQITLPPNSPGDFGPYNHWRDVVSRHRLSVQFESGLKTDFNALMQGCRYVLTTSISEGFGFAFLESWCMGKALWGRLLPDICERYIDAGIGLDHLYTRLMVPVHWLDAETLGKLWKGAMHSAAHRYNYDLSDHWIDDAWRLVTTDDRIDFGLLSEPFQIEVIERVMAQRTAYEELIAQNPFLSRPGPPAASDDLIKHNSAAVVQRYSTENYAIRLMHIYTHVANTKIRQSIDKNVLLSAFLSPHHFSLLKWSKPDE
jgi:glycosyltransferase involved in cell wall biosynthesis